jgi:hypothetical protein
MGKPFAGTIAALATASCLWTTGASAATSVGNECAATGLAPFSFVQMTGKAGGMPIPIPDAGVITSWRINAGALAVQQVEYLKVMRPTGNLNEFATVGESQAGLVNNAGVNTFSARVAVQGGDHLGVFGTPGAFFCMTGDPGDTMGAAEGNPPIGPRKIFVPNAGAQVALAATVEPDADHDGYGDETQDKCPQSAMWFEIPCPLLTLSFVSVAERSAAIVYVTAGVPSQITVSARASGAVPKKKKKRAAASATFRLKPVTHLANPGQLTRYKLKFTSKLKAALASLPKSRSLGLKVTASGTNAAGVVKSETRTLRLKGRG